MSGDDEVLDRIAAKSVELQKQLARIRAKLAGEPTPEERRARFRVIDGGKS